MTRASSSELVLETQLFLWRIKDVIDHDHERFAAAADGADAISLHVGQFCVG